MALAHIFVWPKLLYMPKTLSTRTSANSRVIMASDVEKTASPLAVLVLFLLAFALHRGLNEVIGLLRLTGPILKTAEILLHFVAILFPLWAVIRILGLPAQSAMGLYFPSVKRTSLAIIVGFVAAVAGQRILLQLVPPPQTLTAGMGELMRYSTPLEFFLVVLLSVVVAPVADELLFRGFILRGLLARFSPVGALLISAALTGVFHWKPWMIMYGTLMGLIFGGAVLWTGSVYAGIILHFLLNSLGLIHLGK